jgi:phenylalanyl-tRNA synthetase beta chain
LKHHAISRILAPRPFCNPPLTTQQLADTLTMAGLEVEELQPVGASF